jgi:uncharacterized protein YegP (UPF0339 family)
MSGRFVIKASGDQYVFNLKAGNNEVILTSERYTAKASVHTGIVAVRENARLDARFQRKLSTSREAYFVLEAANHEVLGTSELYSSDAARDDGIEAVKAHANTVIVDDLTRP